VVKVSSDSIFWSYPVDAITAWISWAYLSRSKAEDMEWRRED
jgi:hypothetical protein